MNPSSGGMPPQTAPAVAVESGGVLPDNYNHTRIVLLPRDPRWMFTYWEVTSGTRQEIQKAWGQDIFERSRSLLRVHDVTGISFHGENSHFYWDIDVSLDANRWYVEAKESGRSYCVEIGLLTPENRFIVLARSNVVTLPAGRVAAPEEGQDQWMSVNEQFEKILELSGGATLGSPSMEVSRMLAHRFELLQGISSWASSPSSSWRHHPPAGDVRSQAQNFWLLADTTIVIRGMAPTDATVTLQGQPLTLQADGSFTVRFPLSDQKLEIPIVAASPTGDERQITFTVERKTTKRSL